MCIEGMGSQQGLEQAQTQVCMGNRAWLRNDIWLVCHVDGAACMGMGGARCMGLMC